MESAFTYVFIHGFRVDLPDSKGTVFEQLLREKGIELHQLDAKNGKGHEDASVTLGVETLHAYYKSRNKPLRIIASSMGGFMAAVYASQNQAHVDKLILLNPAINLKETWSTITDPENPATFDEWKRDGVKGFVVFPSLETAQIPFTYVEDSLQYPVFPNIPCPSLIIVGTKDVAIPPKNAYTLRLEQ